jgi:hypothetical protein
MAESAGKTGQKWHFTCTFVHKGHFSKIDNHLHKLLIITPLPPGATQGVFLYFAGLLLYYLPRDRIKSQSVLRWTLEYAVLSGARRQGCGDHSFHLFHHIVDNYAGEAFTISQDRERRREVSQDGERG